MLVCNNNGAGGKEGEGKERILYSPSKAATGTVMKRPIQLFHRSQSKKKDLPPTHGAC